MKKITLIPLFTAFFFILVFLHLISCDPINVTTLFNPIPDANLLPLQELYYQGEDLTIQWKNIPGKTVKIDLYKGNEYVKTIAETAKNDGEYRWRISDMVAISNDYTIKITIIDYPPYTGDIFSSSPFYIDNKSWEELPVLETTEAYNVALALDSQNNPSLVFCDYDNNGTFHDNEKYKARFAHYTPGNWQTDYLSEAHSRYYSIAIGSDDIPCIVYNEGLWAAYFRKWDNNALSQPELIHPFLEPWENYYIFGVSLAIDQNNIPYTSFFGMPLEDLDIDSHYYRFDARLIENTWSSVDIVEFNGNDIIESSQGVHDSFEASGLYLRYISPITHILLPINIDVDDIDNNFPYDYNVSIKIDNANHPVIARLNVDAQNPLNPINKIRMSVIVDEKGCRYDLEQSLVGDAEFQSVAVGQNNIPAIVYKDCSPENKDKVFLITYEEGSDPKDPASWIKVEYPGYCRDNAKPSIVIDNNNNPIIACSNGVSRYDMTTHEWECLGFPNLPGNGSGHQSSWMALNDNCLAVAYIKPGERNKIHVKMRILE